MSSCTGSAPDGPLDPAAVRQAIDEVRLFLDSEAYAADVSWEEHVVLCYFLAQERVPTLVEVAMLERLRRDPGLRRSDVLALALGRDDERVTWERSRGFVALHDADSFRPDASIQAAAKRLSETQEVEIARALEVATEEPQSAFAALTADEHRHASSEPGRTYETYFGFLHAHSHLSDGQGGALEAYTFARDSGNLDFFALTDHGINLMVAWPWQDKWQELKDAAEATHEDGRFVALWGFEWSNPLLGHVNILNSVDFTHTLARLRMVDLYRWLRDRPYALARFNHPGRFGLTLEGFGFREFDHFDLHPDTIPQMVGLELWSKDESFDRYYYAGSWDDDPTSFIDVGNQKGWQLGAMGGQDNHQKEWGTRNDFRTGVLAEALTREAILDAYAKRRTYATEDKDLYLDVRASGYPMGSRQQGIPARFEVTARDASGDGFERVRLFRNGQEIESQGVSGNPISVTFADPSPTGADYYYVIVTQTDDGDGNGRNDEAISSPIWIDG